MLHRRIKFRYNPNAYKNGAIIRVPGVCDCCGRKTKYRVFNIYCADGKERCICPECVANGSAAQRYSATFIRDTDGGVSDTAKTDELFRRTPGYFSWQGEHWLTCCGDYCTFVDLAGVTELKKLGIYREVTAEYLAREDAIPLAEVDNELDSEGSMTGYLFLCGKCGKYHLWVDTNEDYRLLFGKEPQNDDYPFYKAIDHDK